MSQVYLFCADGFEEIEGLTVVDLLRRAGITIEMVSITGSKKVTGSHGIALETDLLFEEADKAADMLVLPGGMPGTTSLGAHEGLLARLSSQYEAGGWIAAICAAPSVFAKAGFLKDRRATSYPTCLDGLCVKEYVEEPVVIDGNVITSRGLGTAIDFALTIISVLQSPEAAERIAASVIYRQ